MNNVTGVVQAVGNKFNGSVKIEDTWYSFKKGVDYSGVKVDDNVTLTLEPWEYKGKSGVNVSSFVVNKQKEEVAVKTEKVYTNARDFDKEAHGKTRCQIFSAAIQSPALASLTQDVEGLIELAKQIADAGEKYTFEGNK